MAVSADPFEPRSVAEAKARLDTLAWLLDSAVQVPGTSVRVGADAILNLIPGVGPLTAKALSAYLILEAHRLGVPPSTLLRMLGKHIARGERGHDPADPGTTRFAGAAARGAGA